VTHRPTWKTLPTLLLALSAAAWPAAALAAKTDVLTLHNGDRITGEVKWLTRGKLEYSTDDAGRLSVEWVKVSRLTSQHSFEVETGSGLKYIGRLVAIDQDGVVLIGGAVLDTLSIPDVVVISALDAGFMKRVRAYLDLGLTYAKPTRRPRSARKARPPIAATSSEAPSPSAPTRRGRSRRRPRPATRSACA
jgi:hypothetical protein